MNRDERLALAEEIEEQSSPVMFDLALSKKDREIIVAALRSSQAGNIDPYLDSQFKAQLEGLAIGLDNQGERRLQSPPTNNTRLIEVIEALIVSAEQNTDDDGNIYPHAARAIADARRLYREGI